MFLDESIEGSVSSLRMAVHDSGYAATWLEAGDSELELVTIHGGDVGAVQRLASPGQSSGVALVWTGQGYLVAWHRAAVETIELMRVCP